MYFCTILRICCFIVVNMTYWVVSLVKIFYFLQVCYFKLANVLCCIIWLVKNVLFQVCGFKVTNKPYSIAWLIKILIFTYSTENTLEFSFIVLLMTVQKINERKNLFLDTVKFLKYEGGKERNNPQTKMWTSLRNCLALFLNGMHLITIVLI